MSLARASASAPTRARASTSAPASMSTSSSSSRAVALSRRAALVAAVSLIAPARARADADADADADAFAGRAPAVGDCADCIGEYNGYLNSCERSSSSCVSSQNDDAERFVAPWAYEGDRATAMRRLVDVATGRIQPRGRALSQRGSGIGARKGDGNARDALSFVARVEAYDESSGYVRLALAPKTRNSANGGFGAKYALDGDDVDVTDYGVFDAEFLFIANDEVVDVRVAQRGGNADGRGVFRLSYTDGIAFDTNLARARAEELRIAIGWEVLPVIAAFDPKWSDKERLWFEKLFDAAAGRPAPETDDLRDMRDTYSYD